ncbi:hypothetical protein [Gaetbulibacter saemankumensis]|uniref:hypothetical protein n=1 Tax=Gaetbulibacter saemankumensis TaxID=311208 RepID=UPI000484CD18|nr:hypothetical protein [Gaetbulibacter saemankumensis]
MKIKSISDWKLLKKKGCILCLIITCIYNCELNKDGELSCIGNRSASLPNHEFMTGYLEEYYYDRLTASVSNDPNDDDYDYNFTIEGRVPEGLKVVIENRSVILEGHPSKAGKFGFVIYLDIEPHFPDTNICINYNANKEYNLLIETN